VHLSSIFAALVVAVLTDSAAAQAMVQFSGSLGCPSFSQTFRGSCNFCSDPPGGTDHFSL
jgi:hypothetical protein